MHEKLCYYYLTCTVYACEFPWVHIYQMKYIVMPRDAYIHFLNHKRAIMLTFIFSSSLWDLIWRIDSVKNSWILAKNANFLIFEDVCGLKSTSTVFINTLNVFSDIKLTCNYKGSHWKALFPELIVILQTGKYFEPFVSV